jgi:hypothetical protein
MLKSLQDEREVNALIHRYATGIDTKDFKMFRSCWADKIDCDYTNGQQWSTGDAITRFMERFHEDMPYTLHRMMNIVLTDDGVDQIKGRTYVHGLLMGQAGVMLLDTSGYYDDVFRRINGEWKIVKRHFINVHTFGAMMINDAVKKARS